MAEENPENTPKYSKKHEEIMAAWELIKDRAKKENNIPLLTYHTWLKDLKIVCIQDNTVYVKTPCCVLEEYIKGNSLIAMKRLLQICSEKNTNWSFILKCREWKRIVIHVEKIASTILEIVDICTVNVSFR